MANQQELDAYSWHEALDRASIMGDIFERTITTHPVIQSNIDLKTKAGRIAKLLWDLYQEVGAKTPQDA